MSRSGSRSRAPRPILTTDSTAYASGEPIIVSWKNAPANRWDWMGMYKKAPPTERGLLPDLAVHGRRPGRHVRRHASPAADLGDGHRRGRSWPLPAGDYVVYYLLADGYEWVAKTEFRLK